MASVFYKNLGKRLAEMRSNNDLKQADIAKILNITRAAYSRYETGVREISAEDICKLADFFDVPIDYILGKIE